MATTVASWIITTGFRVLAGVDPVKGTVANGKEVQHTIILEPCLKFIPPEIQENIMMFITPAVLWGRFRQISQWYKTTIEDVIAPKWLEQAGRVKVHIELKEIPLKDWKFLVEKEMIYGPSVATPDDVRALGAIQDETKKVLSFECTHVEHEASNTHVLAIDQSKPHKRIATFELPTFNLRDKSRDVSTKKIGKREGNPVVISFQGSGTDSFFSGGRATHCVRLPPGLSKVVKDSINWETLTLDVDWVDLFTYYFSHLEQSQTSDGNSRKQGTDAAQAMWGWNHA